MKRFTKTLLSVAAVSAVSAAMAVSAMAGDVPMSASYAGDTVTLANVKSTGAQQTLLILKDSDTVTEDADGKTNIIQIDQLDTGVSFESTKVGNLADGTYYVRVGGSDGTLQTYPLTVSSTSVTTKEHIIGDVDGDSQITANDTVCILEYTAFEETSDLTGNVEKILTLSDGVSTHKVGDVNSDGAVTLDDAVCVLEYTAFEETSDLTGNVTKPVVYIVK